MNSPMFKGIFMILNFLFSILRASSKEGGKKSKKPLTREQEIKLVKKLIRRETVWEWWLEKKTPPKKPKEKKAK